MGADAGAGYSTVMVIGSDCTGGSCGMWFLSANTSCSVCLPGGELDRRLGLGLAVVLVLVVGRDRRVVVLQLGIDQQVMMSRCRGSSVAGRHHLLALNAELDSKSDS